MSRNESITLSKGIAILLMVVAHAGVPGIAHNIIYVFHMPLFFFVSGYCFKIEQLDSDKGSSFSYIKKKLKNLWWPYVKWSLVFLSLHYLLCMLPEYQAIINGDTNFVDFLKRCSIVVLTMSKTPDILGGYWFLKILLLSTLSTFFALKISYKPKFLLVIISVLLLALKFIGGDNTLSYHLGLLLYAMMFYVSGIILRTWDFRQKWWAAVIECGIVIIVAVMFPYEMSSITWMSLLPCFVSAMCGICLTLNFCKWLENNERLVMLKNFFCLLGNHTLEILTWHFLMFKFVSAWLIYWKRLEWVRITDTPVITTDMTYKSMWVIYTAFAIATIMGGVAFKRKLSQ